MDTQSMESSEDSPIVRWPRVSNLPVAERWPFTKWLRGQTRPLIEGLPMAEQDGYYEYDYSRWKKGLPVLD